MIIYKLDNLIKDPSTSTEKDKSLGVFTVDKLICPLCNEIDGIFHLIDNHLQYYNYDNHTSNVSTK